MKASELRIGNWIDGNASGEYFKITAKQILDFYDDPLDDYYQPVPLTEEWLVKFGINNVSVTRIKCYQTILGYYNITIEDNIFKFWISDCDDCRFALDIKYVHQLQNLYFALTGEELTLKDND